MLNEKEVRLQPTVTLRSLCGSVPALPNESADLEREIDEAMATLGAIPSDDDEITSTKVVLDEPS